MVDHLDDSDQRWTARRRAAPILGILKGETSLVEAACKHGLKVAEIEDWQEPFLLAADNALRSRPKDEESLLADPERPRLMGLTFPQYDSG